MSGEVSIIIFNDLLCIRAEHLVLMFFLLLGLQFPKFPSGLGTPIELPHPKIVNLINYFENKMLKLLVVSSINSFNSIFLRLASF